MSDPLSITASTCGIVSLSITICQSLIDYYQSYTGQEKEVRRTSQMLKTLAKSLHNLINHINGRQFAVEQESTVKTVETSILACRSAVKDLQLELLQVQTHVQPGDGVKLQIKTRLRKATYPFRESTLIRLREIVLEIRDSISFALDALQLQTTSNIEDELENAVLLLSQLKTDQIKREVRTWLKAPDPTTNYYAACDKRHAGTGQWFVKGRNFEKWLIADHSLLWVNGFAGCGKTVLSSAIIQQTVQRCRSQTDSAVVFFYFDFADVNKRGAEPFLKSLVLQLASQFQESSSILENLHSAHEPGEPPKAALLVALEKMVRASVGEVYMIVDAIDESPRGTVRQSVLDVLEQIRAFNARNLHILVTSRHESDIARTLTQLGAEDFSLQDQGQAMDNDIKMFITERLQSDPKFKKWTAHHAEIEKALIKRADGMFRWVECQFLSLSLCRTPSQLKQALACLPRSLDETYDRVLQSIDPENWELARCMLSWLCFSERPLEATEILEALAIRVGSNPPVNPDDRLVDPQDLSDICPGLVYIDEWDEESAEDDGFDADGASTCSDTVSSVRSDSEGSSFSSFMYEAYKQIRSVAKRPILVSLAHYSVREYLMSERLREQSNIFRMDEKLTQREIAEKCLIYLLQFKSSDALSKDNFNEYPLAGYSATFWGRHFWEAGEPEELRGLIMEMWLDKQGACLTWRRLSSLYGLRPPKWHKTGETLAEPLFYAAALCLPGMVADILARPDGHVNKSRPIKAATKDAGPPVWPLRVFTPLQAAALDGSKEVIELLIGAGADVNELGPTGDGPLHCACASNRIDAIDILLARGADPRAQLQLDNGIIGYSPLHRACRRGSVKAVEKLIQRGVKTELRGGRQRWTPLQDAAVGGHPDVVRLLLAAGADKVKKNNPGCTAFYYAVIGDPPSQALIEQLWYPDACCSVDLHGYVPLHGLAGFCTFRSKECGQLLQWLKDKGAPLDLLAKNGDSALMAALYNHHRKDVNDFKLVNRLLDIGCDPYLANNLGRLPLHGLAFNYAQDMPRDISKIVALIRRLSKNGSIINTIADSNNTAAHLAAQWGRGAVIQAFIRAGTNMMLRDVWGRSSLYYLEHRLLDTAAVVFASALDMTASVSGGANESSKLSLQLKHPVHLKNPPETIESLNLLEDLASRQVFGRLAIRSAARNSQWSLVSQWLIVRAKFDVELDTVVQDLLEVAAVYSMAIEAIPIELASNTIFRKGVEGSLVIMTALAGDLATLNHYVDLGFGYDDVNTAHQTALTSAIDRSHINVAEYLLQLGVDLKQSDDFGYTPLHRAARSTLCQTGHSEMVKILLKYGADPSLCSKKNWTANMLASQLLRWEVVEIIAEHETNWNVQEVTTKWSPLMFAARYGRFELVRTYINGGTDVSLENINGATAAFLAAEHGHLDVFKLLVKAGSAVEHALHTGRTALHSAARSGKLDVVTFLLDCGLPPDDADQHGNTPILLAAEKGHLSVVKVLAQAGANFTTHRDADGDDALLCAAGAKSGGHLDVVRWLVDNGASIHTRNNEGLSALEFAFDRLLLWRSEFANMGAFRVGDESLESICKRYEQVIAFLKKLEQRDPALDFVLEPGVLDGNDRDIDMLEADDPEIETLDADRGTTEEDGKEHSLGVGQKRRREMTV